MCDSLSRLGEVDDAGRFAAEHVVHRDLPVDERALRLGLGDRRRRLLARQARVLVELLAHLSSHVPGFGVGGRGFGQRRLGLMDGSDVLHVDGEIGAVADRDAGLDALSDVVVGEPARALLHRAVQADDLRGGHVRSRPDPSYARSRVMKKRSREETHTSDVR